MSDFCLVGELERNATIQVLNDCNNTFLYYSPSLLTNLEEYHQYCGEYSVLWGFHQYHIGYLVLGRDIISTMEPVQYCGGNHKNFWVYSVGWRKTTRTVRIVPKVFFFPKKNIPSMLTSRIYCVNQYKKFRIARKVRNIAEINLKHVVKHRSSKINSFLILPLETAVKPIPKTKTPQSNVKRK